MAEYKNWQESSIKHKGVGCFSVYMTHTIWNLRHDGKYPLTKQKQIGLKLFLILLGPTWRPLLVDPPHSHSSLMDTECSLTQQTSHRITDGWRWSRTHIQQCVLLETDEQMNESNKNNSTSLLLPPVIALTPSWDSPVLSPARYTSVSAPGSLPGRPSRTPQPWSSPDSPRPVPA